MASLRRNDHAAGAVELQPLRNEGIERAERVGESERTVADRRAVDLLVVGEAVVVGIGHVGPRVVVLLQDVEQAVAVEVAVAVPLAVVPGGGPQRVEAGAVLVDVVEAVAVGVAETDAGEDVAEEGQFPEVGQFVGILVHEGRGADGAVGGGHQGGAGQGRGARPVAGPIGTRPGKVLGGRAEVVEAQLAERSGAGVLEGAVGVVADRGDPPGLGPDAHFVDHAAEALAHAERQQTGGREGAGLGTHEAPLDGNAVHVEAQFAGREVVDAGQMVPVVAPAQGGVGQNDPFGDAGAVDADHADEGAVGGEAQFVVHHIARTALDHGAGAAERRGDVHPGLDGPRLLQPEAGLQRQRGVLAGGGDSQCAGTGGRERGVRQRVAVGVRADFDQIGDAVVIGVGEAGVAAQVLLVDVREAVAVGVGVAIEGSVHRLGVVRVGAGQILVLGVQAVEIGILVAVADAVAVGVGIQRIEAVVDFPIIGQSIAIGVHPVAGKDFALVVDQRHDRRTARKGAGLAEATLPVGGHGRDDTGVILDLAEVPGAGAGGAVGAADRGAEVGGAVVEGVVEDARRAAADLDIVDEARQTAPHAGGGGAVGTAQRTARGVEEGDGFVVDEQREVPRGGVEGHPQVGPGIQRHGAEVGGDQRDLRRFVAVRELGHRAALTVEVQTVVVDAGADLAGDELAGRGGGSGRIDPGRDVEVAQFETEGVGGADLAYGRAVEGERAGLDRRTGVDGI